MFGSKLHLKMHSKIRGFPSPKTWRL